MLERRLGYEHQKRPKTDNSSFQFAGKCVRAKLGTILAFKIREIWFKKHKTIALIGTNRLYGSASYGFKTAFWEQA